jgi:hypothetical protein
MTAYQDIIREELARAGRIGVDPVHVEAFMRLDSPTLDGLSATEFGDLARESAATVHDIGPAEAANVARSFGLIR